MIAWAKDLRRSIDYLETRPDIDTAKVAYYGLSWGGYLGGLMPAIEPRLKAVVLLVAGLEFQRGLPEVEPINFLPRITIPVLMLNGSTTTTSRSRPRSARCSACSERRRTRSGRSSRRGAISSRGLNWSRRRSTGSTGIWGR